MIFRIFQISSLSKLQAFLFLVFLAFAVSIIIENRAEAAPTQPYQADAYNRYDIQRLPSAGRHLYMSKKAVSGASGNYVPEFQFLVYAPSSASTVSSVRLYGSLDCSDFEEIDATAVTNDDTDGSPPPTLGSANVNLKILGRCVEESGGIRFNIPGSYFGLSQKFGDSYKVTKLHLAIDINSSPRSVVVGSSSSVKLGYIGDRRTTPNDSNAPSITRDGGGTGNIEAEFGPPCDFGTHDVAIRWKDADSGTSPNNGSVVEYRILEQINGSSSWNPITPWTGAGSTKNVFYSRTFTAVQKTSYKITFRNVWGEPYNNTIQIMLPFDQAGYSRPCDFPAPPNSWRISWVSNYVNRSDGINMGQIAGDVNDPGDVYAPQPGQVFRYINDARNTGTLSISNARSTCPDRPNNTNQRVSDSRGNCYQSSSGIHTHSTGRTHYDNDRDWVQIANTQDISFSNGAMIGRTAAAGGLIGNSGNPGWVWDEFSVNASHGGTTRCMAASATPSLGQRNTGSPFKFNIAGDYSSSGSYTAINTGGKIRYWNIGGMATAPTLCVNVPYYYDLRQEVTVDGTGGGTIQQGSDVQVSGNVNQSSATGGRQHTNSHSGKEKGILQFRFEPGEALPSDRTGQNLTATSPIDWCQAKASAADCSKLLTAANVVPAGGRVNLPASGTRNIVTDDLPVGTKLCYATYANHPRNTTSGDVAVGDSRWSYSGIECATVVKSPKVQFNNTDLTVGRYRNTSSGCSSAVNAPIIGVPSPTSKSPDNQYGSWVEYGAFATGEITGFGSGAVPFGISSQPHRLTFGNNNFEIPPNTLGNFIYGKNCLSNAFSVVKDNNYTDLNAITDSTVFDDATGFLDMRQLGPSSDKTGYVSTNKSIVVGEKTTPSTPGPTSGSPATAVDVPYTITVTAGQETHPDGSCAKIRIKIVDLSSANKQSDHDICNEITTHKDAYKRTDVSDWENWSDYAFNTTVSGGGVFSVEVTYLPPDSWGGTAEEDRNVYVKNIELRNNDAGTERNITTNRNTSNLRLIAPRGSPQGAEQEVPINDSTRDKCFAVNTAPSHTAANDRIGLFQSIENAVPPDLNTAWCAALRVSDIETPTVPVVVPPALSDNYTGFNSRTIVVYSKKTSPGNCSATSDGNITINKDIIFKRDGFASITEVPRLVFMADCNITIDDGVKEVNASLVAGDAIKTCSTVATRQDQCNERLTVRGAVSANRLLLWRTYGADISTAGAAAQDPRVPAETFELSPSQVVSGFMRGLRSATPTTVYEVDLPPRY